MIDDVQPINGNISIKDNLSGNVSPVIQVSGELNNAAMEAGSISTGDTLFGNLSQVLQVSGNLNNPAVETGNYNKLENKPIINDVVLQGSLKSKDLDLQESMDYLTNIDIERLIGD